MQVVPGRHPCELDFCRKSEGKTADSIGLFELSEMAKFSLTSSMQLLEFKVGDQLFISQRDQPFWLGSERNINPVVNARPPLQFVQGQPGSPVLWQCVNSDDLRLLGRWFDVIRSELANDPQGECNRNGY